MPGIVSWLLFIAAMLSLVAFSLLIVVALEIRGLIRTIKDELLPVIGTARQTVTTMQGTSEFVSTGLIKPLIAGVSAGAGVARTVQVLTSGVTQVLRRSVKSD